MRGNEFMDITIIVAIISASGTIVAVIIKGIFSVLKKNKNSSTKIEQKQKGNNNIQIGIQNNYGGKKGE